MEARERESDGSAQIRSLIKSRLTGIWLGRAKFFGLGGRLENHFETRNSLHAIGHLFYHHYDLRMVQTSKTYSGVINGKIHRDGLLEFRSSLLTGFGRLQSDRLFLSWQTHQNNFKMSEFTTLIGDNERIRIRKIHHASGFRGWMESRESRFQGIHVYHGSTDVSSK